MDRDLGSSALELLHLDTALLVIINGQWVVRISALATVHL